MTIGDARRGARDYFWFALALIVVLIGAASRASAADAATDPPPWARASHQAAAPLAVFISHRRSIQSS
jgi:hypothetical protein